MQVHYYLTPAGDGPFNLMAIQRKLSSLPGAFMLEGAKEPTFVVATSQAMAKYLSAKLKMDPRMSLATQGMVTLSPNSIQVFQDVPQEILMQLEDFVTWLLKATPCRVLSEEGEDWTDRYAANPRALFKEEDQWT